MIKCQLNAKFWRKYFLAKMLETYNVVQLESVWIKIRLNLYRSFNWASKVIHLRPIVLFIFIILSSCQQNLTIFGKNFCFSHWTSPDCLIGFGFNNKTVIKTEITGVSEESYSKINWLVSLVDYPQYLLLHTFNPFFHHSLDFIFALAGFARA